jgi:hypothetical protein
VPAREFVQRGGTGAPGALAGAFSRKDLQSRLQVNQRLAALRDTLKPMPNIATAIATLRSGFLGKELTNQESGTPGTVTGGSLHKMKDQSSWGKSVSVMAHYTALGNLDTLFELATRTGYREGEKLGDKNNIKAIHKFTTPMPYQGEVLDVVMTVREFYRKESFGGTHQLYTLESLEIETPASYEEVTGAGLVSQSRRHQPAGVTDRLVQMRAIVKGDLDPDVASAGPDIRFSRSSAATVNPAAPSRFPSIAPFRARMDKIIDGLIYNFQD